MEDTNNINHNIEGNTQKGMEINNVPVEFICPLTLKMFDIPMVTRYGHTFERRALLHWLEQNRECPLTYLPLNLNDVIVNRGLLLKIRAWKNANRQQEQQDKNGPKPDEDVVTDEDTDDDYFYIKLVADRPLIALLKPTKDVIRALVKTQNKEGKQGTNNHSTTTTKLLVEIFKKTRKQEKRNSLDFFQEVSQAA